MSSPPPGFGYQPTTRLQFSSSPPTSANENLAFGVPPDAFGAPPSAPHGFVSTAPDAFGAPPPMPPPARATWWNQSETQPAHAAASSSSSSSTDPEVLRAQAELLRAQTRLAEVQLQQEQLEFQKQQQQQQQQHDDHDFHYGGPATVGRSLFAAEIAARAQRDTDDEPTATTGTPQDSFEVELGPSLWWGIIPAAAFVIFICGIGAVLTDSVEAPGKFVLLGVGGVLTYVTNLVGCMFLRHVFISKRSGEDSVRITVVTFVIPMFGFVTWESKLPATSIGYSVAHWTSYSSKNGTSYHNCLVLDEVGLGSWDESDCAEAGLDEALGRKPARGSGSPDNNVFFCSNTYPCTC